MLPPSNARAERLLERAGDDPEFDARLRAAYQGRHDVLDALWWAAHPLTSTPRGTADPASELRELQRAAFSRSAAATPAETLEAERRLHEAERALADDARHLAEAVAAVESTTPAIDDQRADDAPPTEGPVRPLRKYLVPSVSVAAVLAAILVFPTISGINADADGGPAPTAPPITSERVRTEIVTLVSEANVGDPFALLEREQTPDDLPPEVILRFDPQTYRALPGLVPHAALYASASEEPDSICLVVVRGEMSMSTCTTEPEFDWLRLGAGRFELNPNLMILTESYQLLPDGQVRYEATARATGDGVSSFPGIIEND